MSVHLFLCFSVLPEQAQTVKNFPDPAALCRAQHIVPMLAVIIQCLIEEDHLSESSSRQGDPVIMHHRVPGERPGQDEPHQGFIHHHGASGHIVLDQKLVQSAPLRGHLLVFHIGGRDLLLFLIHYTHVAMHEERNCTCGILRFFVIFRHRCLRLSRYSRCLRLSHGGQRLFHFIRMPDVVLVREHIILAGRRLAGRRLAGR